MTDYRRLLLYWIKERYAIFQKKEAGLAAPWSDNPIFQATYFCNVHRENDRVTRWVRNFYNPYVGHPLFEYNMVLARFLNRPATLAAVGFQLEHAPAGLIATLEGLPPPIWGNAYVITTHGQRMGKLAYLSQVLSDVHSALSSLVPMCRAPLLSPAATCQGAATALQRIDGIGSFLSAQVVADLKNTPGHPLYTAKDKEIFVQPGPGSLRGLSWYFFGEPDKISASQFMRYFPEVVGYVTENWPDEVPPVDAQDLQNCLCEYDKYCRVLNGTGRSKRNYNGRGN